MMRSSLPRSTGWLLVGGGIHGTYLSRELLEAGVDRSEITIVDARGELLGRFRERARASGMDSMRSTYVQHVGGSPFGLETFAEAHDREDDLLPTHNYPSRPSLDLFLTYAERIAGRFDLRELLVEATVTGISSDDRLIVETGRGRVRADRVVLAIGPGDRYRRPTWATASESIEHVWDSPAPPENLVCSDDEVGVVGGGITAGQWATAAADTGATVSLYTRSPLEEAISEADPRWLNWRHIEQELHRSPPGSSKRYERLREARNEGTMPPYVHRAVEHNSKITVRCGEIYDARERNGGVELLACDGTTLSMDRVFLATGFESIHEHPLVETIAESLSLRRGYCGMPVLDDDTLAWCREDGRPSNLYVTGRLAEGTVGPFAGNIAGARRAAERLVDANVAGKEQPRPRAGVLVGWARNAYRGRRSLDRLPAARSTVCLPRVACTQLGQAVRRPEDGAGRDRSAHGPETGSIGPRCLRATRPGARRSSRPFRKRFSCERRRVANGVNRAMTDDALDPEERRGTDEDGHDVIDPLYVAIVTVSSSRDPDDDPGGDTAAELVADAGGQVTARELVRDDFAAIRGTVDELAGREDVDCIVTTGGTGMTMDDVTPAACEGLFEREIPGFGELFRMLSYEEIGHRAMASRATAGVVAGTPVFCLPGSRGAVKTALNELVLPEAPHLAGLATRHRFDG